MQAHETGVPDNAIAAAGQQQRRLRRVRKRRRRHKVGVAQAVALNLVRALYMPAMQRSHIKVLEVLFFGTVGSVEQGRPAGH